MQVVDDVDGGASADVAGSAFVEPGSGEWRHVPALDGLRAAAVVAVLVFHGGYLQGGFLGVDLFFALSGFLITSLLIRDATGAGAGGRGIVLGSFWGRRFRRLLPAVFVMIAVVALWAWVFGSGADVAGVQDDGPWAVLYLANWHFVAESGGYWESFAQPSMFDHLWSLAIEEQFYLLWPVVLVAIWKWSRRPVRTLVILSVSAVVVSLVAMVLLYDGVEPTRVYMGTDTRAASLLVGALAATPPAREWARRVVGFLGARTGVVIAGLAVFVGLLWVGVDGASSGLLYRGGLLAHSVVCAVIISLVVALDRGRSSSGWLVRGLGWAPLVWVGVMSYGLYLWHWPIYTMLSPERTGLDGAALMAVRLVVSVVVAYVSFRVVEDPIRRRASWALGRSGMVVLGVSVVAMLGALFLLPDPPVEIAEFDPASIAVAAPDTAVPVPPAETATTTPPVASDSTVGAPATTVVPIVEPVLPAVERVVWAGDSVAFDLAPAIGASLAAGGWAVDDLAAYPGNMLTTRDGKFDLAAHTVERSAATDAELAILQISNWDVGVSDEEYAENLRSLSDQLAAVGTRLLVLSSPPTGDAEFSSQLDRLFGVAQGLAAADPDGNLQVIDGRPTWGTPGVLDLDGDGTPERKRDLMHVCPSGAARFVAWFTDQLADRYGGLTPGDPAVWAADDWVSDSRFNDPVGTCAAV